MPHAQTLGSEFPKQSQAIMSDHFQKTESDLDNYANQNYIPPQPAPPEGRFAIVTKRWRGMRWTLRRQAGSLAGRNAAAYGEVVWSWRRDRGVYPARLCGLGNGDNKRRSPGRARISRKAIARGKPGCLGCTCLIRVRCFYFLHTVLRAQSAPGFPCALCSREGQRIAKLGRNRAVRTRAHVFPRHCERSEAIQLRWAQERWIASSLRSSQ